MVLRIFFLIPTLAWIRPWNGIICISLYEAYEQDNGRHNYLLTINIDFLVPFSQDKLYCSAAVLLLFMLSIVYNKLCLTLYRTHEVFILNWVCTVLRILISTQEDKNFFCTSQHAQSWFQALCLIGL